jgi:hypothetical protein
VREFLQRTFRHDRRLMRVESRDCARGSARRSEPACGIWKKVRDLETFLRFGGFCFQIASSSAWQSGRAEGIIEDGGRAQIV